MSGRSAWSEVSLVRVGDGDTLVLETQRGEVEVRLSGVNAPDRGECGHGEATARLAAMVDDSRLALAVEGTDQFGRALGRLEADDSDVALALVREGHGLAVATAPNSYELLAAEGTAHAEGIGMWATDSCGAGSRPHVTFDPGASVPDPAGRDEEELDAEVIVIVNRGDHAVDLSRWVLRDGSSRHRYRFGSGVMLQPGATIQIDSADPGWSPGGGPVWSNEGDIALLLDPLGGVVARWRYDG
jgi:endonuclease YncB( thermonuclease family)